VEQRLSARHLRQAVRLKATQSLRINEKFR